MFVYGLPSCVRFGWVFQGFGNYFKGSSWVQDAQLNQLNASSSRLMFLPFHSSSTHDFFSNVQTDFFKNHAHLHSLVLWMNFQYNR